MEKERTRIPLFNGKNFSNWKFWVEHQLDELDLLEYVQSPLSALLEPFASKDSDSIALKRSKEESRKTILKHDKKCKNVIVHRIHGDSLEVVKGKENAYEMWRALRERYEARTTSTRVHLLRELHALKYKPRHQTFQDYCLCFDKIIRELKEAGDTTDDAGIVILFLITMPDDYEPIVAPIQAMIDKDSTMAYVRVRISEYETAKRCKVGGPSGSRPQMPPAAAFLADDSSRRRNRGDPAPFPYECNNCGVLGHRKIHCWRRGGGAYNPAYDKRLLRTRGVSRPSRGFRERGGGAPSGRGRPGGRFRGRGRGGSQNNHGQGRKQHGGVAAAKNENVANLASSNNPEAAVYCFMANHELEEDINAEGKSHRRNLHTSNWGKISSEVMRLGSRPNVNNTNVWYVDSGASGHMVQGNYPVINKKGLKDPVVIRVAKDGLTMTACNVGEVIAYNEVNGVVNAIHLKNVLIIDDLKFNLLSVSRLEVNGYDIIFTQGKCLIIHNGVIVSQGLREGMTYKIILATHKIDTHAALAVIDHKLWHRRLGHIGQQGLLKVSKMVDGIMTVADVPERVSSDFCDTCVQGKQVKLPFPGTRTPSTRPLERIHSDLCGPISPVAYNGSKYLLIFVDDYSHFTVVFGLKSKTEVAYHIKLYEARVTSRFNSKISNFRCDNGTEFVNHEVKDFFIERGIQYELTIPGTPENDGVSERMFRTIGEKGRCMLIGSNLPKSFWIEAVYTAVYLINRSPTRALCDGVVPAEKWLGKRPNLSKLKVFGCMAYMLIPKAQRKSKFDSKSFKCIMLGYTTNGYRLWHIGKDRVVSGRNVVFDESVFPRREGFSQKQESFQGESFSQQQEGFQGEGFPHQSEGFQGEGFSEQIDEMEENTVNNVDESISEYNGDMGENEGESIELVQEPLLENSAPRRSCRVRVLPKHLKDYALLIQMAKFTDDLNSDKILVNNSIKVNFDIKNKACINQQTETDIALSAINFCEEVPLSFEELKSREDKHLWLKAVHDELESLEENQTWTLIPLPEGKIPIKSKWVFTLKYNGEGQIDRYKARLVVKGCAQREGIDYQDTYAPVARLSSLRILLSIVNKLNLHIQQLDVKNAFLNGILKEDIYMLPPEGLEVKTGLVCKLNRTLYGLKQAPLEWNRRFDDFATALGYRKCKADSCVYVLSLPESTSFLLLFVDDILLVANSMQLLNDVKAKLMQEFKMRDLGDLQYFLGIKITRNEGVLHMSQGSYLRKVLKKFKMDNCASVNTPITSRAFQESQSPSINGQKPYRELIGSLMYACIATRPDICVAVNYFSQFQVDPTEEHWKGLKRILRYLQGTLDLGISYRNPSEKPLVGYADADYANNYDRKSVTGFVIEVFGNTVSWCTRKQKTVALSTTEAEFVALATASTEILWLKQLLSELRISITDPIPVFEDNQSCIHALKTWDQKRMKHIDVKYNFIRDLQREHIFLVQYIQTQNQKADFMTKPLAADVFCKHRLNLGMQ